MLFLEIKYSWKLKSLVFLVLNNKKKLTVNNNT